MSGSASPLVSAAATVELIEAVEAALDGVLTISEAGDRQFTDLTSHEVRSMKAMLDIAAKAVDSARDVASRAKRRCVVRKSRIPELPPMFDVEQEPRTGEWVVTHRALDLGLESCATRAAAADLSWDAFRELDAEWHAVLVKLRETSR